MASDNAPVSEPTLFRLFCELFKIALFVVGGGYAILAVADEVFGRRLKWLRSGELVDRLPVFQTVPGLIAGNTAIYVGLRTLGRAGAVVGLVAIALPSFVIFLAVSYGYARLPMDNAYVTGALSGLRAALTGILFGTLARSWVRSVRGLFGYAMAFGACALTLVGNVHPVIVLVSAMAVGIVRALVRRDEPEADAETAAFAWRRLPLSPRLRVVLACVCVALVVLALGFHGAIVREFTLFGLLSFGGGFSLVPIYLREFVGEGAPFLRLAPECFSDLIALTQATPGPVSINAATYFGFRMGGVTGALTATVALLAPSYFLLTAALKGLARGRRNRFVRGLLAGARPATSALLISAGLVFARMSIWTTAPGADPVFHPLALLLALFAGAALWNGRLKVMHILFCCALAGVAAALVP